VDPLCKFTVSKFTAYPTACILSVGKQMHSKNFRCPGQACSISSPKFVNQARHSSPGEDGEREPTRHKCLSLNFPLGSAVEIPPSGDKNTQS